jgi:hypothetical protein
MAWRMRAAWGWMFLLSVLARGAGANALVGFSKGLHRPPPFVPARSTLPRYYVFRRIPKPFPVRSTPQPRPRKRGKLSLRQS